MKPEKLKSLRNEKDWTQKELAEKLFISEKTVSAYECGTRMMDSDMLEKISKLFGYEWLPEEKKEKNHTIVTLSDIASSSGFRLDAGYYIGKQPATLRVDIEQRLKKQLRQLAEEREITIDEITQEAIEFYLENKAN